ncbi:MAG: chromosomal replication initiator DnaA [Proteobacteria bacterium]|nr:chromosomal replication initiator DnaA [Pseudomonadota bacterium]
MIRIRQLALPFPHRPDYAASAFIPAPSNEAALAWLDRAAEWPGLRLALWGEPGCGKTHLLHRWAARTGAAWFDGAALRGLPPAPSGPVALDDADLVADEEALLHLLNAAQQAGHPLLMAAPEAPARWPVRLPDLASRLRAITAARIGPPDDALLRRLLTRLLAERKLAVPEPVQAWILLRLPRSAAAIREAAALLDRAAWEAKRDVTRRLAEQCLEPLIVHGDEISGSEGPAAVEAPPLL